MLLVLLSAIVLFALVVTVFMNQPAFGSVPSGSRLERIKKSPNYKDGQFQNLSPTPQMTSDKGFVKSMIDFLFRDKSQAVPDSVPVIKTDLHNLSRSEDVFVWFGHSSYFIQIDGKRFLVDPVFCAAAPLDFMNKKFKGTEVYTPDDIPEIDFLIITHDHWDHLDYKTVTRIRERTGRVICPLGVGEHFERWGFDADMVEELDWNENAILANDFKINCLPARHFSGRGLRRDKALWASFLLETPSQRIFIGGDGGYDSHFAEIGERFAPIDFAILENGQYNSDWRYIHTMPALILKEIDDLRAAKVLTVHHSKYCLATHSWKEPLENIEKIAEQSSAKIFCPMIGEPVNFKSDSVVWNLWWK